MEGLECWNGGGLSAGLERDRGREKQQYNKDGGRLEPEVQEIPELACLVGE